METTEKNRAALLSGQEPLWTALFAFLALGAWLDGRQLLGAAVMLAAVFYINRVAAPSARG